MFVLKTNELTQSIVTVLGQSHDVSRTPNSFQSAGKFQNFEEVIFSIANNFVVVVLKVI